MHQVMTLKYTLLKGFSWQRLIIVKNRYNHRLIKPTESRAYIKTGTATKFQITSSVTSENGILLSLTGSETNDLPTGDLSFDVWAVINGEDRPVAQGTISVSDFANITPREATDYMEIRFKERTDWRQSYAWKDSTGALQQVQNAFMQAKDDTGNTVVDLRWYSSKPSEATIIGLAGNRRGYICPADGATIEVHISDKNTVTAGEYKYDLYRQDMAGDWDVMFSGVLVVEDAVSIEPV